MQPANHRKISASHPLALCLQLFQGESSTLRIHSTKYLRTHHVLSEGMRRVLQNKRDPRSPCVTFPSLLPPESRWIAVLCFIIEMAVCSPLPLPSFLSFSPRSAVWGASWRRCSLAAGMAWQWVEHLDSPMRKREEERAERQNKRLKVEEGTGE